MESEGGSKEPLSSWADWVVNRPQGVGPLAVVTTEEQERIADGEPYCFRCGKPASSFPEYVNGDIAGDAVHYVLAEEGTWNPATNRFACDACYIAIGMPAGPDGWRAP